jgi:hypothetical protein
MTTDSLISRNVMTPLASGNNSIEETELYRKVALLKLFCKIVMSVVAVCWVLQSTSSLISGRLSPIASFVIGSILTVTFIAWRLVERDRKHYRMAGWLLISGVLFTTIFTYAFFGGNSPIILIFLVPLGLAAALLSFGETVAVCLFIMVYTAALYIGQYALNIYKPPLQITGIGAMIMGLIMCGVVLPLVSALITFPAPEPEPRVTGGVGKPRKSPATKRERQPSGITTGGRTENAGQSAGKRNQPANRIAPAHRAFRRKSDRY